MTVVWLLCDFDRKTQGQDKKVVLSKWRFFHVEIRLTMRRSCLALAAWLVLSNNASACGTLAARESPLENRRPVRSEGVRLTAGFGVRQHPLLNIARMHTGVDWSAPLGTPVIAAGRGRVIAAGREGQYGNRVIIDHRGAWQTLYAQLASFAVREGDCVEAGTVIGAVGATGLAAGPHIHFEVRRNGQPVDPMALPTAQRGKLIDHRQ